MMINRSKQRKLEHKWKYVGSSCYDSEKGIRIHVGGLLISRIENIKGTMFQVDRFRCPMFSRVLKVMGGNIKRALMFYAEYYYEVNNND